MAQIESALREMMEEGLVELGADENDEDIYSLTGKGIELESTGEITKEKGGEKHGQKISRKDSQKDLRNG